LKEIDLGKVSGRPRALAFGCGAYLADHPQTHTRRVMTARLQRRLD